MTRQGRRDAANCLLIAKLQKQGVLSLPPWPLSCAGRVDRPRCAFSRKEQDDVRRCRSSPYRLTYYRLGRRGIMYISPGRRKKISPTQNGCKKKRKRRMGDTDNITTKKTQYSPDTPSTSMQQDSLMMYMSPRPDEGRN